MSLQKPMINFLNWFKKEEYGKGEITGQSRGLTIEDFESKLGKSIFPMYKAEPPFMKFEEGFGYQGVVLYDTKTDRVQCHFCGKWFHSFAKHYKLHKMTSNEYKDKVGLYRGTAMVGMQFKVRKSKTATKNNLGRHLGARRVKGQRTMDNGHSKMQFKNAKATCEAQLKDRLLDHQELHGTFENIRRENRNLYAVLHRRFGGINEALKFYKLDGKTKN